jgi:hypothetical protein
MQKINFKRSLLVTALIASSYGVFSQKAEAGYCLPMQYGTAQSPASNMYTGYSPPMRETTTGCTGIKTTDTLTGKAASLIEQIKDDIRAAGKEVKNQMKENAAAVITTVSSGDETIVKTIMDTTNTTMQDELKLKRSFLKMEMDYMSELKEREVRAAEAPMDLDDTKEEVQFMQYALANTDKKHAQEVIADMQAKYPNGKLIPVKIKSGSSTDTGEKCPEYDPAKPNAEGCFVPHKAFPAAKLAKYFDECSRSKRRVVSAAKKTATEKTVSGQVQKSQNEFAATTTKLKDSVLNNKILTQAEINCNPYDFAKKFCLQSTVGSDKGAYVAKVVANEIIPNGNISSNNLFKPLAVGTIDGEFANNLTEAEKKSSGQVGLDLNSKSGGQDVAVSDNTVPIVYTYRTSSQYLAAKDFVDNVLAKELIPNQDISDRKSGTGTVYQSRFLSRAAAMSVAEFSMNKTIESRIGKNLKDAIDSGKNMNPYVKDKSGALGTVVKEDVNGAAWIDEIADSINKDYQKVIVSASKEANGGTAESLASMSSKKPEEWQLEAIIKQNELTLEQYHQGERMEFLLASLLAQLSNSPENIKHLEDLRRQ